LGNRAALFVREQKKKRGEKETVVGFTKKKKQFGRGYGGGKRDSSG